MRARERHGQEPYPLMLVGQGEVGKGWGGHFLIISGHEE